MLRRITKVIPYIAAVLAFGLFVVHPAQALELSYPSFFPIKDTLTIGDFTKLIFNASIGVGSLALVVGIIMAGFQLATGGQSPLKLVAARRHIVSIVVGMLLLVGAVIFLNALNPDIVNVGFRDTPVFPDISVPTLSPNLTNTIAPGSQFSKYALGKALDNTEILIQDMYNSLPDRASAGLVTQIKGNAQQKTGLAGCSASACQGINPVEYIPGAIVCRGEDCVPHWECQTPSTCVADPCTQSSGGSPEPCTARDTANTSLGQTVNKLNELRDFWNNEIKPVRAQVQSCITVSGELLNYSLAVPFSDLAKNCRPYDNAADAAIAIPRGCAESTDYFCGNEDHTTFKRLTLKIPELLQKEQALIDNINTISSAINACSCSNTQFVCPSSTTCSSGIGTATGNCSNRISPGYENYDRSCSPDTWSKLAQLNAFRIRLQNLGTDINSPTSLAYLSKQIDEIGIVAIANYDPTKPHTNLWFSACNEAKKLSSTYQKVSCSSNAFCCPEKATRDDTQTCRNEDFYYCDGTKIGTGGIGGSGGVAGSGGKLGIGFYSSGDDVVDTAINSGAGTILLFDQALLHAADIKARKPSIFLVGRIYVDDRMDGFLAGTKDEVYQKGYAFGLELADKGYPVDAWQTLNEPPKEKAVLVQSFDLGATRALKSRNYGAVVGNWSVANPDVDNLLTPEQGELNNETTAYFGYHSYGPTDEQFMRYQSNDWALRYRQFISAWQGKGWRVPSIILNETGINGYTNNPQNNLPGCTTGIPPGWKCFTSAQEMLNDFIWLGSEIAKDNVVVGTTLFLWNDNGSGQWVNFEIKNDSIIFNGLKAANSH